MAEPEHRETVIHMTDEDTLRGDIHVHLHIDGPITVNLTMVQPQLNPSVLILTPGTPRQNPKGEPLPVPDFILEDDQNVDIAVQVGDEVGNVIAGAALDAGSVTATPADDTTLAATVSADQSSVNVAALGGLTTDNVVTVAGSLNGTPLYGTIAIDVVDSAAANIVLVPGTPSTNAGEN